MITLDKIKLFAFDRLFKFGTDFVILNNYFKGNDFLNDFIWNLSNKKFVGYIISNPDSRFRIRQFASSCYHFSRLLSVLEMSALDYGFSNVIYPIISREMFSSKRSKERAFKRVMMVLKRNGCVYNDIFEFLSNFANIDYKYRNIINDISTISNNEKVYVSKEETVKLIHSELGLSVNNLNDFPDEISGPFTMFDTFLPGIGEVTISVMSKRTERMRRYDLIPFKLMRFLMSPISSLNPEKAFIDTMLERLDVNITKEVNARKKILEKFGVDFSQSPAIIFRNARKLSKNVYIPAPILQYTSKHVMITDRQIHYKAHLSNSSTFKNITMFTKDLVNNDLLFPNIGLSNLRRNNKSISFSQFSSLTELQENHPIQNIGKLAAGILLKNEEQISEAAAHFGIDGNDAVNQALYSKNPFLSITRQLMKNNSNFIVPSAEVVFSLSSHLNNMKESIHDVKDHGKSAMSSIYNLFTNPLFRLM